VGSTAGGRNKINSKSYFKSEITGTEQDPTVIEFEAELTEGSEYNLIIEEIRKRKKPNRNQRKRRHTERSIAPHQEV
jgi:hypothetical protein